MRIKIGKRLLIEYLHNVLKLICVISEIFISSSQAEGDLKPKHSCDPKICFINIQLILMNPGVLTLLLLPSLASVEAT